LSSKQTSDIWPGKEFQLNFHVELAQDGNQLICSLRVLNQHETEPLEFQTCLHTYLSANIQKVQIYGLEQLDYFDKVRDNQRFRECDAPITIESEVDRVYLDVQKDVSVETGFGIILIQQTGLPDAVVWNPWIEKSQSIGDLPDDAYLHYVCVESGRIATPFVLPPGEIFTFTQTLTSR
jgi:glucose-6-phosphate 1-epimerase